jgi:hypothetical protein
MASTTLWSIALAFCGFARAAAPMRSKTARERRMAAEPAVIPMIMGYGPRPHERVRGGMSIREAAKAAGVNRETVRRAVLAA